MSLLIPILFALVVSWPADIATTTGIDCHVLDTVDVNGCESINKAGFLKVWRVCGYLKHGGALDEKPFFTATKDTRKKAILACNDLLAEFDKRMRLKK